MTDHGNADLLLFLHLISVREASRLDFELAGDGDAVATDVAVDAGPGTRRADGPVDAARAHSTFALRSGDHFFAKIRITLLLFVSGASEIFLKRSILFDFMLSTQYRILDQFIPRLEKKYLLLAIFFTSFISTFIELVEIDFSFYLGLGEGPSRYKLGRMRFQ